MSKSGGTARSVSTSQPSSYQLPYLQDMLSEAQRLYQTGGPQYYPDSTVAQFAPAENLARNYLQDFASNRASQQAEGAENALQRTLSGEFINVAENPYVQQVVQNSVRPAVEQLTREVLPSIRSSFINTGGFGGSKQGIAEGMAIQGAQQALADSAANTNLAAYGQGLQSYMQGLNLAPSIQNMGMLPGDILQAVGGQERAMDQANLNDLIARWQYGQNLPYNTLADYSNLLTRTSLGGQAESTTITPETGTATQIASTAATLYPILISLLRGL